MTRDQARAIVSALPPLVSAVGVFVNQVDEALGIARDPGPERRAAPRRRAAGELPRSSRWRGHQGGPGPRRARGASGGGGAGGDVTVLLDAHDPAEARRHGTQAIDWALAAAIARARPIDSLGRPERRRTSPRRSRAVAPLRHRRVVRRGSAPGREGSRQAARAVRGWAGPQDRYGKNYEIDSIEARSSGRRDPTRAATTARTAGASCPKRWWRPIEELTQAYFAAA